MADYAAYLTSARGAELQEVVETLDVRARLEKVVGLLKQERINDELSKLRLLEPSSPEFNLTRNYLDWLTVLPWGVRTDAKVTLPAARQIRDEDHYGLDDVKARIQTDGAAR